MRGGERVVECICDLFPEADIFTLVYRPENISDKIKSHKIVASFIDRLPLAHRRHQLYLALFPMAIESFDLSGYDLVLSSSTCVAKGVITKSSTRHICYCNTPMRYAWEFRHLYTRSISPQWLLGPVFSAILSYLRIWDVASASRVDHFIANSKNIRRRISSHYRLPSSVVFPPVDDHFFVPSGKEPENYWILLSAMVPYKRLDIAIEAFNKSGRTLKVVGEGSEKNKLKALALENIEFLGRCSDEDVRILLQKARGLVFPGEEDFGITPLEANACGRPVVAYRAGGVVENQFEGVTAVFFSDQTAESLAAAVEVACGKDFDSIAIRKHSERFSRDVFKKEYMAVVESVLAGETPAGTSLD
jgi:glycosyltransferase involved in cell wall biosynthesis